MRSSKIFLLPIFAALVSACSMSSSTKGSSGGDTPQPSPVVSSQVILIDPMTVVPNLNGVSTTGTLYIHNYSNSAASNLQFSLASSGLTTNSAKVKRMGLSAKSLNSSLVDSNGFALIDPTACSTIPAGGYCAINFKTPSLSAGDSGNSLVKVNYNLNGKTINTSQVVNYTYVDLIANSGVNFTGDVRFSVPQTATRHAVAYLYAGGAAGTKYSNVNISQKTVYSGSRVSRGFTKNQEILAGTIIPVEFEVDMQSSSALSLQEYATWGGNSNSSSQFSTLGGEFSGTVGLLEVDPIPNNAVFAFGEPAIMKAPTSVESPNIISVTNIGSSKAATGISYAIIDGVNKNNLSVTNNCADVKLESRSQDSCTINFGVSGAVNGNAVVEFSSNGTVVATKTLYWTGKDAKPILKIVGTPIYLEFGKSESTPESGVSFAVTNIGYAPLQSIVLTAKATDAVARWEQDSITCNTGAVTTINPGDSCTVKGHLVAVNDGYGKLYYAYTGSYNTVPYKGASNLINYTIKARPYLDIVVEATPFEVMANGRDVQEKTFTVTNTGDDPALFIPSEFTLASTDVTTPAQPKPTIKNTDCVSPLDVGGSCHVVATLGPVPTSITLTQTYIATLTTPYHGGTPDTNYNNTKNKDYSLLGNNSTVVVSDPTAVNLGDGDGKTSINPFVGYANITSDMLITFTYTNPPSSENILKGFAVSLANKPVDMDVDRTTTCGYGAAPKDLAKNDSCVFVLKLNRTNLGIGPGTLADMKLDFPTPIAEWTTDFGNFSSTKNNTVYVDYHQPMLTVNSSSQNINPVTLTFGLNNSSIIAIDGGGIKFHVDDIFGQIYTPPTATGGCTMSATADDYSADCDLTAGQHSGTISYTVDIPETDYEFFIGFTPASIYFGSLDGVQFIYTAPPL